MVTTRGKVAFSGPVKITGKQTSNTHILAVARVLVPSESGKTFFLNVAGGFQITLPEEAEGLKFTFIVKIAPTTAYTIITAGTTQKTLKGLCLCSASAAADVSAGGTTFTFAANQALPGDRVDFECDGTYWYALGFAQVAAGITITGE